MVKFDVKYFGFICSLLVKNRLWKAKAHQKWPKLQAKWDQSDILETKVDILVKLSNCLVCSYNANLSKSFRSVLDEIFVIEIFDFLAKNYHFKNKSGLKSNVGYGESNRFGTLQNIVSSIKQRTIIVIK
jgi:hypothetical protein